ncbi:MotA/TolQ/ExbB proton channel family protein [Roseospira marina]|uniref:MotA/TolQ/ExbB proton channel family protein n=2 Tax=Roseospira marina TaxID=140057 RepID=A0A5M6IHH0_9PROT|nr:MotA/TolQ/ExbB proton channel family protein [Roseospira marina]
MELLGGWLEAGGPIIVILAALALSSLALIVGKAFQLAGTLNGQARREAAVEAWRAGDQETTTEALADGRRPADRVLATAMAGLDAGLDRDAVREDVERHGNAELEHLRRHLRTLEVIATVSPLLGLLGTVLGLIQSLQGLEMAGGSANASVLAGGIWQALLTTAVGLLVAIPAAIAASLMAARVDHVGHGIEDSVARLMVAARDIPGRRAQS